MPRAGCVDGVPVEKLLETREVKNWSATLETNADKTYHLHLMLQFYRVKDRAVENFAFRGVSPNARSNDLLGEGCSQGGLCDWTRLV